MRARMAMVLFMAASGALAQELPTAAPKLLRSQDLETEVEADALQRQFSELRAMRLESVEYSRFGSIERIVGDTGLVLPTRAAGLQTGDTANDVLHLFKDLLLAAGTETLRVLDNDEAGFNPDPSIRVLRLSQEIRGIPVLNSFIGVDYDEVTREVSEIVAQFVPDRALDRAASISAERAELLIAEAVASRKETAASSIQFRSGTSLAYYQTSVDPTPPRLVWVVQAQHDDGMQWVYYVDAINGVLVDREPAMHSLTTKLYNANGQIWAIPADVPTTSMNNAQIAANPMTAEAKPQVPDADSKLRLRLNLPSSKFPSQTRQIVDFGYLSPNAYHQIVGGNDYITYSGSYSGGAVPARNSATHAPDITYHEYTHGIVARVLTVAGDDRGAINEGFSDIGSATVQIALAGSPSNASWKTGEGWYVSSPSTFMRSMANPADGTPPDAPNADWYPRRTMTNAHYDSTILTHAYYLSIYGGLNAQWLKTYIPEITVPALDSVPSSGESYARQIFVSALASSRVVGKPLMLEFKGAAMDAATSLYPLFPARRTSIQKAFEAVGVGYQCSAAPATPNPDLENLMCNGRFAVNWPAVPGADRYIVMVAPQLYGWPYGDVTTDGNVTHCMVGISSPSMLRMRACNSCGCSNWSDTEYMPFSPGPCP